MRMEGAYLSRAISPEASFVCKGGHAEWGGRPSGIIMIRELNCGLDDGAWSSMSLMLFC